VKRKIKRHHWGWIVGFALIAIVLAAPIDIFVSFVLQAKQKVEITKGLIETITTTTKAATSLVVALSALLFYKVMRK